MYSARLKKFLHLHALTGAAGEINEIIRAYGKGRCSSLVFDVPRETDTMRSRSTIKKFFVKHITLNDMLTQ